MRVGWGKGRLVESVILTNSCRIQCIAAVAIQFVWREQYGSVSGSTYGVRGSVDVGRPRWNGRGSAWAGGFYVALLKEIVVMITVSYVNYDYCEEVARGIVMTGWASGLPDINTKNVRGHQHKDKTRTTRQRTTPPSQTETNSPQVSASISLLNAEMLNSTTVHVLTCQSSFQFLFLFAGSADLC